MKFLIPVLVFLAPAYGLCSESATPIACGSSISSTVTRVSCLVPGMTCTRGELDREYSEITSELALVQVEINKVDARKGSKKQVIYRPTGDAERDNLQRRAMGLRRLECRLRKMKKSMRASATVYVQPDKPVQRQPR